jgi:hypothetical protein
MVRRSSVLAALAAITILLAISPSGSPVAACVGGPLSDDPAETFDDLIFTGTAVRVDDPRAAFDPMQSSADLLEWSFVVDDVRKGSAAERVTVRTERSGSSCGTEFQLGRRYRVVAIDRDDGFYTGQGYGTKRIDPLPDSPAVEGSFAAFGIGPLGVLIFVELGLLAALIYTTRARRRSRAEIG